MEDLIAQLKTILGEISDLKHTTALLEWDQQTYMPAKGVEARSYQLGLLKSLMHERVTSPELGKLLKRIKPITESLDPDSDDARLVKLTEREMIKQTCVPAKHVEEFAKVTTLAQQAWVEARSKGDYSIFLPHLERIIQLRQEYSTFFPGMEHPYDAQLDDYEPNMKTADVKAIFNELRVQQVELIRKIASKDQVDDSFLHQPFNPQEQLAFGKKVITDFGFDWERGRQDLSLHPFTIDISINDVRLTTRITPDFLNTALFGTMHECGHALYGMGARIELERTGLEGGNSLGIHESQSRFWENLVGRSKAFWEHYYPTLQRSFPQLQSISLETFYKGINIVKPTPVRVESDEATYNLHIMLRFELEIALLEGSIAAKDLPMIWNERMYEYLGITPPNDIQGVLQDIHWSNGSFGYFPTYALGNLVSVQLWEKLGQDIPDLDEHIRNGRFVPLLEWLREKIHQHGAKFDPQELVKRVTGSRIDPKPYIQYLLKKYSQIYDL